MARRPIPHGVYTLRTVPSRLEQLAVGLAGLQVLDAIANAIPRRLVKAHLDHLGVPNDLRPVLPVIKVTTAAGLLVGLRAPRVGAMTSALLVAYYAAAVRFHLLANDHPVVAAPAAAFGASAALTLVALYLPAIGRTETICT
jgi:hypothetical protein